MKRISTIILIPLFTFFYSNNAYAQVVINEFSSTSNPEWIELYNPGNSDIPLNDWTLLFQDNPDTNQKTTFSASDVVPANGYKIFERGYSGTQAWLSNTGDTIVLKDQNSSEVDSVRFGSVTGAIVNAPSETQSAGRSPDGSSSWVIFDTPSKESPNVPPTPIPTQIPPTNTPTPNSPTPKTPTPTPTKTSSQTTNPTATPTPTSAPTAMKVPTKASSPTPKTEEASVLSENVTVEPTKEQPTPTPPTLTAGFFEQNLPKIFIIGGGLFLLGAGILFYKTQMKGDFDETDSDN